jgi:dTDP-glucose 4,6-dehydratase
MQVLVTGGAGFIGSNFIRLLLQESGHKVINFDALTYAGNLENLADVAEHPRYRFVKGDIRDRAALAAVFRKKVEAVVNFAAESHVDRSIASPAEFLDTNVVGTAALLEAARSHEVRLFIQVSTDEVYGSLGRKGLFREDSPLAPNSPYAASKASADLLARAYLATYGLPVIVTRSSNNYGPFQFPEKFIPLFITNALEDKPLPLYGDGLYCRDWIHVEDNVKAMQLVLEEGKPGAVYNIGGGCERMNLDLARLILDLLGKPHSLIRHVADRPGHDRRYALESTRIRDELGFVPDYDFERGLAATVKWYREHEDWWRRIKSGAYREYYRRMYGHRLRPKAPAPKP